MAQSYSGSVPHVFLLLQEGRQAIMKCYISTQWKLGNFSHHQCYGKHTSPHCTGFNVQTTKKLSSQKTALKSYKSIPL